MTATLDRSGKWLAQTPQMFRLGLLQRALAQAGAAVTDEPARSRRWAWRRGWCRARSRTSSSPGRPTSRWRPGCWRRDEPARARLRIGEGWDTHALVAGRPLVLGGVTIPHSHGLLGHSDADALLHAITDALLGAAGLGDIGRHFPDTDPAFQGADSIVLLQAAAERVRGAGWAIVNIDSTIVAQAPKLAPHIPAMRERIAAALGLGGRRRQRQGQDGREDGPGGRGPGDRGARRVPAAAALTPLQRAGLSAPAR